VVKGVVFLVTPRFLGEDKIMSVFSPPSDGGGQDGVRQNVVAKKRRRNQNVEIDELGELVPYRRADGKALDKLSVLRLTTSFFKFQDFMTTGN
jgi:hypothetical protein